MQLGNSESHETQLRERAMQLAHDLSGVNWRQVFQHDRSNLRFGVNPKMKELMDLLAELEGRKVEKSVVENGVIRFQAGDASKSYGEDGRFHSLGFFTRDDESHEQAQLITFIDARDGGSMTMEYDMPPPE